MEEENQINGPQDDEATSELESEHAKQSIVSRPQFTVRHMVFDGCEIQSHSHTSFTVTAVLSGNASVTIGADDYEISKGETAFTNIGQNHAATASGVELLSIGINPALVDELASEMGMTRASAEIIFRAHVVKDETISQTALAIACEMAGEMVGQGAMIDAIVRQLVIHLLRSHLTVRKSARIEFSRAGPVDRRLRRAIEFMHNNYSRELALEEIASAAYLSEYHFARLFKQITGLTVHAYLANLRLDRARKLLVETALPISEIASTVGYQSQSHFTKIFKSVTGTTPRAYRDSARGDINC